MSLNDSSSDERAINIGGGRTYQLYWCYQCHRTVRIASENQSQIVCPRCSGQFLYEIDIARPRFVVEFTEFDPSPEARLLEALSLMLDPPVRQSNNRHGDWNTDVGIQAPWQPSRGRHWPWRRQRDRNFSFDNLDDWGPESGIIAHPRPRSWIILRPTDLRPVPEGSNNNIVNRTGPEGLIPGGVDPRNYFVGSGLNELIEELTQNDRPGPPPAPDSVINALPTVEITPAHLLHDYQSCPVCMEEFKVGGEAKELPCKHIFHSNCIVPWLRLHNSCPVCRHELPVPTGGAATVGGYDSSDDSLSSGDGRRRNRRCWRWRRLVRVWPFRQRYRPLNSHGENINNTRDESRSDSCDIL